MDNHLNIICYDVPYPPDYGGVIDPFYKLKALQNEGVKIHLHCFEYGRLSEQPALNSSCEEVFYYKRKTGIRSFSSSLPFIVSSRINDKLIERLSQNDFPLFLEGIHSTGILNKIHFNKRKIFVRLFNVEHLYYQQLRQHEKSFLKRFYYRHESRLLYNYEKKIAEKVSLIAFTEKDANYYNTVFHADDIRTLPAFIPWDEVTTLPGSGLYCLYHGNLSVAENERVAEWLILKVFNDLDVPFIIAGKNPSSLLLRIASKNKNVKLIPNPADEKLDELIRNAHINILPSLISTGLKLKLLHALFCGRHCLVNHAAIPDEAHKDICEISESSDEIKNSILELFEIPFTNEMILKRSGLLNDLYNNKKNAKQLTEWIFSRYQ